MGMMTNTTGHVRRINTAKLEHAMMVVPKVKDILKATSRSIMLKSDDTYKNKSTSESHYYSYYYF